MTYEEALRATAQERWAGLTMGSRLEVLQAIEDHVAAEAHRTPRPVEGKWLHVEGDGVILGQYSSQDKKIQVNLEQLRNGSRYGGTADPMVETVLHEGRHSYQWQVTSGEVRHPDVGQARDWAANLEPGGYVDFEQNPRGYWRQPVEADARTYAAERLGRFQQERASLEQTKSAREVFERQSGWGARLALHTPGASGEQKVASPMAKGQPDGAARHHGMRR